jgi:predicted site-specific integrase-resolvase
MNLQRQIHTIKSWAVPVVEIVQEQESRVAEFGQAMKKAVYDIGTIRAPSRIHTKNKRYNMKLEIVETVCTHVEVGVILI